MKNTLYVSDLDGTLLDRDSRLSDESVLLLNKLIIEQNINFTIATARTPATVVNIMERVNTKLPFIVMNGAATWDNKSRRFVHTTPLPPSTVKEVCSIFEAHGLNPMVYCKKGDSLEVHHCGELSVYERGFVEERRGLNLKKFVFCDTDYKNTEGDALLIFSMNDYERLEAVYNDVMVGVQCSSVCYHDIFDSAAGLMETYAPGVSKAISVRRLADEVCAERIVVFGDNRNDIPMMKIADCAVAPENAVDEVKAIADVVIEPNYMNSVVRFIADSLTL